jgi:hypothetical protein
MKMIIDLYECKKVADLNRYTKDLVACGATVISSSPHYDEAYATLTIEVKSKEVFIDKFAEKKSFEFSSLA